MFSPAWQGSLLLSSSDEAVDADLAAAVYDVVDGEAEVETEVVAALVVVGGGAKLTVAGKEVVATVPAAVAAVVGLVDTSIEFLTEAALDSLATGLTRLVPLSTSLTRLHPLAPVRSVVWSSSAWLGSPSFSPSAY